MAAIPWILYLAGGYGILSHLRAKKTIIKVSIICEDEIDATKVSNYLENSSMMKHIISGMDVTTTPFGNYGICSNNVDKKLKGKSVDLYVSIEYRGNLQWSLFPF